jgi:hypothetical protein
VNHIEKTKRVSNSSPLSRLGLGLLALVSVIGFTAHAAGDAVLTAKGTNGSHDFEVTFTQNASGSYHALARNFGYRTEFTITQDATGAYQVVGKTPGLFNGTGHSTMLTLRKNKSGDYLITGTNSSYKTDLRVSVDGGGTYRAEGLNLGYQNHLTISGSGTFHVEGENGSHRTNITASSGRADRPGVDMKDPLPLQVLLAMSAFVGAKPG